MRLLVVSQYFWPENFRINDLVAEFVKRGHQVTVLTGLPNYPDGKVFDQFKADPVHYSKYEGAEIVRVPLVARGRGGIRLLLNYLSFAASASFIGLWKLRGRQFDVIFTCQLSPVTVGLPAAVMRTVKRAPMAFWVLDLWPESLQAVGVVRSKKVLQVVGSLVSFIYKRCDLILAQSKSFIPQIQKYAAKGCRIEYFPSWAESVFHEKHSLPADEVPLKLGSFNVMFAGNIGDAQDFSAILAAAENLKSHAHIRWLIVGDGRMAHWVADEIRRRNLQDCVLMLGRYTVDRMPSFFKHADVLLVSLKDEPIFSMTIPGKLQSYLAAGIPVVAMLNGEGAELIVSSRSGVTCAAGDHNGLSEAVLKLFEMPSKEREALGQNGLNASVREFHRDTLMDQMEGWLEKLKVERLSISLSRKNHVKRVFDLFLTLCIAVILILPLVIIAMAVRLTSPGPVLYWSDRVGRNNRIFKMPKFRSMRIGTPAVATHLLQDPDAFLTPIGSFLRKNSLDELPQLWSIFIGDMSFVGPRPALFNQYDLIDLRTQYGVQGLLPGITGWAQVNGRDDLCISEKVTLDTNYLHLQSLLFDMCILWLTFVKVLRRDGVSH
jgi:colanic acid biosynthesis glycosyl transferase WcaI